jgi:ATP-dependent Clp protease ATP-binding subunit ClpX
MEKTPIKCSFCGRDKKEVSILIAGINGHICNFCIEQAHGIVAEEGKEKIAKDPKKLNLLKPAEIKDIKLLELGE